ncbi:S-adenosyl-L-methionine-dependent methyltransferase [Durotheca rogersii]|uniref:S-adenosyl-L-methionine-dependent methyltransferase n=1 Tax=Durotheca rogersii TaxID=419775 RepID=UPI00221F0E07|nr:S-adenosyl-L-methionine-dependent methyltransferase [Durotheca rogersii]KAI5860347.1 S-adenosyl-L-methionine-dependent methyltransferase [Durotheca rogersii]
MDPPAARQPRRPGPRQPKPPPPPNPIEAAVRTWFCAAVSHRPGRDDAAPELADLVAASPRRWSAYGPLVLLPAGAFAGAAWRERLAPPPPLPQPPRAAAGGGELERADADALWREILAQISRRTGGATLTHLAVNEGIPSRVGRAVAVDGEAEEGEENVLRSPAGLRILYGDFGPATAGGAAGPGPDDFARALWVSTRQNGVAQTWAPRWTMFSRGNVKEKARLLGFHGDGGSSGGPRRGAWAVDLYAGIGYFAFSYARLGLRVLCWELNPWSVEGLRRGARANGWAVRVVRASSPPPPSLLDGDERIVVFLEDNRRAARRIAELATGLDVLHVNCGLLPTSEASWADAWEVAARGPGPEAWLHLHENVGAADVEARRGQIEVYFSELARTGRGDWTARVQHTELVKTFAPGVWHCVFDLHMARINDGGSSSNASSNIT